MEFRSGSRTYSMLPECRRSAAAALSPTFRRPRPTALPRLGFDRLAQSSWARLRRTSLRWVYRPRQPAIPGIFAEVPEGQVADRVPLSLLGPSWRHWARIPAGPFVLLRRFAVSS